MIPVFDDWASLALLLPRLDAALASTGEEAEVLVVNDGSTLPAPSDLVGFTPRALRTVRVLELHRNLGHQRAIAIGLTYVHTHLPGRTLVVMDGDGEDAPEDVPRLLARFQEEDGRKVVFAGRKKRSESLVFVVFYHLFRGLHLLLTGHSVRVGNFSVLPPQALRTLVVVSELWNHYAAAVYKARIPRSVIPTERGTRIAGRPTMNFPALVTHGLSAMSVFGEAIGARLLIASGSVILLALLGVTAVIYLRFFALRPIPGWAYISAGVLVVIVMQAVVASGMFIFTILNSRQGSSFLPIRDFAFFCEEARVLYSRNR
ncbi:MAG TPA: glycosyltransferase [Longimicrobiaceae bacterium]|nr:glycosyltransferase [Longimicrobiaceae bacterium]